MLSIANVSSGMGSGYFTQDDYYLTNEGSWKGALSPFLGIKESAISHEVFNGFMTENGLHQGCDLQFSVPENIWDMVPFSYPKQLERACESALKSVESRLREMRKDGQLVYQQTQFRSSSVTVNGQKMSVPLTLRMDFERHKDDAGSIHYTQEDRITKMRSQLAETFQHAFLKEVGMDNENVPEGWSKRKALRIEMRDIKRKGFDLTFSAPKSVSIAMAMNPELKNVMTRLHHEAVQRTLDHIEQHYIFVQQKVDGKNVKVQTDNMCAARFTHFTSRNQDPQLHSHCVILNKSRCVDGKVRALWETPLYQNKMLLGQVYRNQLAAGLKQAGFDIRVSDPKKGLFELEGVSQDVLDQFSSRRKEIVERLEAWDTSDPKSASRAALLTRHAKENRDLDLLMESWREDLNSMGATLDPPEKGTRRPTHIRYEREFEEARKQMSRTVFAFTKEEFQREALRQGLGAGMDLKHVESYLENRSELISLGEKDGKEYFATAEGFKIENDIIRNVEAGLNTFKPAVQESDLFSHFGSDFTCGSLSEEQRQAVQFIATNPNRYVAIQGLAGVGKTYMLNHARTVLEQNGYQVRGIAFTGKAAEGLQREGGIRSKTIHSFLNELEKEAGHFDPNRDLESKDTWYLDGLKPREKMVLFVDEASMVDNVLLHRLMDAAGRLNAQVVLIGDRHQLQPIGAGNAFTALVSHNRIPHMELTDIRRQKVDNLQQVVREAVQGDVNQALDLLSGNVQEIEGRKDRLQAIVRDYVSQDPEKQTHSVILTAGNHDRKELNEMVRDALKATGRLEQGIRIRVTGARGGSETEKEFSVNDQVVFLRNDRLLGVKNGTIGRVAGIADGRLMVDVGDRVLTVDPNQYNTMDHAYAITTHKAQGISIDKVFVHAVSSQRWANSRNAFYVNVSRAKYDVQLYTDDAKTLGNQVQQHQVKLSSLDFPKETIEELVKRVERSVDVGLVNVEETGLRITGIIKSIRGAQNRWENLSGSEAGCCESPVLDRD